MLTLEKHPFRGARIPFAGSTMPEIPLASCKMDCVLDICLFRFSPVWMSIRYQDKEHVTYNPQEYAYILDPSGEILHDPSSLGNLVKILLPRKILLTYYG